MLDPCPQKLRRSVESQQGAASSNGSPEDRRVVSFVEEDSIQVDKKDPPVATTICPPDTGKTVAMAGATEECVSGELNTG